MIIKLMHKKHSKVMVLWLIAYFPLLNKDRH